jgi:hypothetical protein
LKLLSSLARVFSLGLLLLVPQCFAQEKPPDSVQHEEAERELKQQERQRILGIVPQFNTSDLQSAARLSPKQKFRLAFKSATDPFTFLIAGVDSGINQWENDFAGYGQGAAGYGKRLGASYTDNFNGTMLGNALFPVLLHQDPRYFRKGTGSFVSRFAYAALSTVRAKGDDGKWQPNYSNLLGNLAAGGIANLYYPEGDRGADLVFKRGISVSLYGAIGAELSEFWPDISRKLFHKPSR